jgi:hypothetical protein
MTDWVNGVKKLRENFGRNASNTDIPKFGMGNPKDERTMCQELQVFCICYNQSKTPNDKTRLVLHKNSTIRDVTNELTKNWPRDMSKYEVSDENYFVFGFEETRRPLWYFSKNCSVSLLFSPIGFHPK